MREQRILQPVPTHDLDQHLERGGGEGLRAATAMSPEEIIATVEASGLRGRGGAGFPTALKWSTVAAMSSATPASVVVNAAEGEPGSFKDRTLIRNNPYQIVEGALIAARAVGADRVVLATKEQFRPEVALLERAAADFARHGVHDVDISVATGPSSYLFGEESALLEVVDGRPPLPRVNPPFRRGIGDEAGPQNAASSAQLAGDDGDQGAPSLVNNVETLAHVAFIFRHGVDRFRAVGTEATPGTTICTVTGAIARHGVGEFAMGTPLWEVVDTIGGGPRDERILVAAISGTANAVLTADRFDTPLCFDAFRDAGSGLGASGFVFFDDGTDLAAAAHGVARFLAVESCGQCTPCKVDGAAIAERLDAIRRSDDSESGRRPALDTLFSTVADGARCGLAAQQQTAVASLHRLAEHTNRAHLGGLLPAADVELIAPIIDIVDDEAIIDASHLDKALDWTTDGSDSGAAPADRDLDRDLEGDLDEVTR